jgi:hypothetical protein
MAKLTRMVLGGIEDLSVEKNKLHWMGYTKFEYTLGNSIVHCETFLNMRQIDSRLEIKKDISDRETFLGEVDRLLSLENLFLAESNYSVKRNVVAPDVHRLHGKLYKEKPKQQVSPQQK